MPSAQRLVAALAVAGAVALLAGCAPLGGPSDDDRATWAQWYDEAAGAGDSVGGTFEGADADDDGTRIAFESPETYRSVELRCIGSDRATFTLTYTGTAGTSTLAQEIVCHDGGLLTPIAIPTELQELTAFEASAASSDGVGYWVATLQP